MPHSDAAFPYVVARLSFARSGDPGSLAGMTPVRSYPPYSCTSTH